MVAALQVHDEVEELHPCLVCRRTFATKAAWGAHAFKLHGRVAPARAQAEDRTCDACGRMYLSNRRLSLHLAYSNMIAGNYSDIVAFVFLQVLELGVEPIASRNRMTDVPGFKLLGQEMIVLLRYLLFLLKKSMCFA